MKRTRKQKEEEQTAEKRQRAEEEPDTKNEEEEPDSANQILVKNETYFSLAHGDLTLLQSLPNGGTSHASTSIPARSTADLTFYRGRTLVICRKGITFRGDVQLQNDPNDPHNSYPGCPRVLLDSLGSVFYLVEDPTNRPVTDQEVREAHDHIITCLEHGGRVPTSAGEDEGCWQWIAKQIGRTADQAEKIENQLRDALAGGALRQRWDHLYYDRRPVLPAGPPDAAQLQAAIGARTLGVVVYFRALDRFPGGNADYAVFKFKLQVSGPAKPASKCPVEWMAYRNWDGTGSTSRAPVEWSSVTAKSREKLLLDPLNELIGSASERSVETTIVDNQSDSDEYDTEWSSIEVLLYAPPGVAGGKVAEGGKSLGATEPFVAADDGGSGRQEQWPLVFRLHQRALLPVRYREDPPRHPAEGAAKKLLDGVSKLFKMGRVESTLDEVEAPTDVVLEEFRDVYLAPLFLNQ